jgi:hypothetical protein
MQPTIGLARSPLSVRVTKATVASSSSLLTEGEPTKRSPIRVQVWAHISLELGRRLASVTDDREPTREPEVLANRLIARYRHHVQERVGAIYLDSRSRVLRKREIYVGTLNSAMVFHA